MCTKADTKRDKTKVFPEDVEAIRDIEYGQYGKSNLLDVYRPMDKTGAKLPVIVSVHGGGWVYGNKEVYQFYTASLAQRGFAVVNFNYRLAPKYKFPAQMEDVNSVFTWILANSDRYGFDTDNIFAVGDSAGACLLAMYACAMTNEAYSVNYDFYVPKGLNIRALGLNCGMYDTKVEQDGGKFRSFYKELCPKGGSREELELFSVIDYLTPKFPPSFILTANHDDLKDRQPLLLRGLEAVGVPYSFKMYGDEDHNLYHVFHCDVGSTYADLANDDECAYLFKNRGL